MKFLIKLALLTILVMVIFELVGHSHHHLGYAEHNGWISILITDPMFYVLAVVTTVIVAITIATLFGFIVLGLSMALMVCVLVGLSVYWPVILTIFVIYMVYNKNRAKISQN